MFFIRYLYKVAPIFKKDPTVVGITGFNYYGYRDVASSLDSFYRTSSATTIATLLPKSTVRDILAPLWPQANNVS